MPTLRLILFAVVALFCNSVVAWAQEPLQGIALIIGNSDYGALSPLENPENDAEAMEEMLSALGFETELSTDRNAKRLRRDLENFLEDAEEADVALFYYAGHGVEAGGENFIVPVDADPENWEDGVDRLVPLNGFLQELQEIVPVAIVLVDACRINPFPADFQVRLKPDSAPVTLTSTGLGVPQSTRGAFPSRKQTEPDRQENVATLIGFAAEPGRAALDGAPGGNSPYAAALLRHVGALTGADFSTVMSMVAEEVYLKTKGRQRPWVNQSLRRQLFFGAGESLDAQTAALVGERRQLLVHIATLPNGQRSAAEALADRGGVPMDVVFAVMRAAGIAPDAPPNVIEARLRSEIDRFAAIRASRKALLNPDPEILRLSELADQAELEGALETANTLREQAKDRLVEVRITREEQISALKERILEDAAVYARSAETKELLFRFSEAAEDYGAAFDIVAQWDMDKAFLYRRYQIFALSEAVESKGDKDALTAMIDLSRLERENGTLRWNDYQLARFFKFSGQANLHLYRETGEDQYFAATQAHFSRALELNGKLDDREHGAILGDLGGVAFSKAVRTGELEDFEAAVGLYRQSLDFVDPGGDLGQLVKTFDDVLRRFPRESEEVRIAMAMIESRIVQGGVTQFQDWVWIQANLGTALSNIGSITKDTETEEKALEAFYFAIQGYRSLNDLSDMARYLGNRGNLYLRRAQRGIEGSAALAHASYIDGLNNITHETHPVTYLWLAMALADLTHEFGETLGVKKIDEAIGYLWTWREAATRRELEEDHKSLDNHLGLLLYMRGNIEQHLPSYKAAYGGFKSFFDGAEPGSDDQATAARNLGLTERQIGKLNRDTEALQRSVDYLDQAQQIYRALEDTENTAQSLQDRGVSEHELALITGLNADYLRAARTYGAVAQMQSMAPDSADWAYLHNDLGNTLSYAAAGTTDEALFEEASAAYKVAATVFSALGMVPDAVEQANGGAQARHNLALIREDAAALEQVIADYKSVADKAAKEVPQVRLLALSNAGLASQTLHFFNNDIGPLSEAVRLFEAALALARQQEDAGQIMYNLAELAGTASYLAQKNGDSAAHDLARRAYLELLDQHAQGHDPVEVARWANGLAYTLVLMNRNEPNDAYLDQAVKWSTVSRQQFRAQGNTEMLAYAQTTSCDALLDLARRDRSRVAALEAQDLCQMGLRQLQEGEDEEAISIAQKSLEEVTQVLQNLPD